MKNKYLKAALISIPLIPFAIIIRLIALVASMILGAYGLFYLSNLHWTAMEYEYYSDEDNFIEVTAEIDHVYWNYSDKSVTISLVDAPEISSYDHFHAEGENFSTVIKNGGKDYLKLGATVTIVTAPRYFGDGYIMPIVAMSVDGHELLSYEDGYKVLMESYHKSR